MNKDILSAFSWFSSVKTIWLRCSTFGQQRNMCLGKKAISTDDSLAPALLTAASFVPADSIFFHHEGIASVHPEMR